MIKIDRIHSLSDLQADPERLLKHLNQTGQPEKLTVGDHEAVLLSPEAYAALIDEVERARGLAVIDTSVRQIEAGQCRPMRQAVQGMIDRAQANVK